jgi:hypothetical protein
MYSVAAGRDGSTQAGANPVRFTTGRLPSWRHGGAACRPSGWRGSWAGTGVQG